MTMLIEKAARRHFPALRAIELASFETLRDAGTVSGEASASSDDELAQYLNCGCLYAAFDGSATPVGYVGGHILAGRLHVAEMDVHPDWQKRGIGRLLMTAVIGEGRARHLLGASLTTDRLARFNAPFYASLGFRIIEGTACPAHLAAILASEAEKGFDPLRRVAMMMEF